jgi:hypothetical protein
MLQVGHPLGKFGYACQGSTSIFTVKMFLLLPIFVVRQLLWGVHEIQQLFFADVPQVKMEGADLLVALVHQRHYLHCKPFVLL